MLVLNPSYSYIELIVFLNPGLLSTEVTLVLYTPIYALEKSTILSLFNSPGRRKSLE